MITLFRCEQFFNFYYIQWRLKGLSADVRIWKSARIKQLLPSFLEILENLAIKRIKHN